MAERTPRRFLVAVDFSANSRAALAYALRLAKELDASVEVHHVVHDPAGAPGSYDEDTREAIAPIEVRAREMMTSFLNDFARDHRELDAQRLTSSMTVGLPPTRLLEVAKKIGATEIVMGSRGRTGLGHLLLGSKAERVVQLSPIPVIIVKIDPDSPTSGESE